VLHRGRAPRSSAQVAAQWRFVPTVPFELQPHATALISPATAQLSPLHSPPPSPTARATAPRTALPSTTACGSARTTSVQAFANPTELKVGGAMSSSLTPQADDPFGGRSIRTRARFESRSTRPCVHRSPRRPALMRCTECCPAATVLAGARAIGLAVLAARDHPDHHPRRPRCRRGRPRPSRHLRTRLSPLLTYLHLTHHTLHETTFAFLPYENFLLETDRLTKQAAHPPPSRPRTARHRLPLAALDP
jgi:hypothetical protein